MARGGVPIGEWSGADATKQLEETIKAFNEKAGKQTDTIIGLTKWLVVLTIVMTAAVFVQVVVGLRQVGWL